MNWKNKAMNTADVRLTTRWKDPTHRRLRRTWKQKLTLAMQTLLLEACLLHHPKCYDVVVGGDVHDGVLNGDGMPFLVSGGDDEVVLGMLLTKNDGHYLKNETKHKTPQCLFLA